MIQFVNLKSQYLSIQKEISAAIRSVFNRSQFILGPEVEKFEKKFTNFCRTKYAIGVNSGTAALHLALLALGVKPGDEVITVPNSFFATTEAILLARAKPVFVDVEAKTQLMNLNQVQSAIAKRTRVILPVHLFGQMVNMEKLRKIARLHKLPILEDACQAHGATFNGKPAGSWGDIAAFSFYPAKNLGAYGDAGAIMTNRRDLYERIRLLRDHGSPKKYFHSMPGFNARMNELEAAVLNVKLKYLPAWNKKRREIAVLYSKLLAGLPINLPFNNNHSVFHLYVIQTRHRDALRGHLQKNGISTGIHYPVPIHLQKAVIDLGYKKGNFPVTEKLAAKILSLPMYPELRKEQIKKVAQRIKNFFLRKIKF